MVGRSFFSSAILPIDIFFAFKHYRFIVASVCLFFCPDDNISKS